MQLVTTRFGAIEVDPETVITFTQPIIGFPDFRRFILLPGPQEGALFWLQSTDSGQLAFLLLDPKRVVPDYEVLLPEHDLSELAANTMEDLMILTLVVVPNDPSLVRTNLKAPLAINTRQRLGKQVVLEKSEYPIQFFLARNDSAKQRAAGGE